MKTTEEIYQQMMEVYTEKTGFSMQDSCDLAVRLYAAAAQIESLYLYADWVKAQTFPQTASGTYLDYHGQVHGITRMPGVCAETSLKFYTATARTADLEIPAGTVVQTSGNVQFQTSQVCTIAAGSTSAEVGAAALLPGLSGNVAVDTVTQLTESITGVSGVTNTVAGTLGRDEEDDEAYRTRILAACKVPANGANAAYYEQLALACDGIVAAKVIPRYNGVGTVGIVIATQSGVVTPAVIQKVKLALEKDREIAVVLTVMGPTLVPLELSLTIWPTDGTTFDKAKEVVSNALNSYFSGHRLGQSVYLGALSSVIYQTGVVKNFTIASPASDTQITDLQLATIQSLTITEGT